MTFEIFPDGTLPPRVYGKSGRPVLLNSCQEAERLAMLLIATDKKNGKWQVGGNENGWWFCYRGPKS